MGTVDCTGQSVAVVVTSMGSANPGDRISQQEHATRLRYRLASAGGSWGREFRLLLTLADGRGVTLDTDALALYDVRDLQALQRCVATAAGSQSGRVARH